jgi:hypothetical protein
MTLLLPKSWYIAAPAYVGLVHEKHGSIQGSTRSLTSAEKSVQRISNR